MFSDVGTSSGAHLFTIPETAFHYWVWRQAALPPTATLDRPPASAHFMESQRLHVASGASAALSASVDAPALIPAPAPAAPPNHWQYPMVSTTTTLLSTTAIPILSTAGFLSSWFAWSISAPWSQCASTNTSRISACHWWTWFCTDFSSQSDSPSSSLLIWVLRTLWNWWRWSRMPCKAEVPSRWSLDW